MFLKKNLFNFLLLFFAFLYYFFFINKGIVLYDEGYYAHIADRILRGEVPYKDFFLQFSPGYFYLLAFAFKLFGEQIITERILVLFICLLNIFIILKLGEKFSLSGYLSKTLFLLASVSFGFPLINNSSLLAWISVLISLVTTYFLVEWYEGRTFKSLILFSSFVTLMFFVKQNLGLYFLILVNIFILTVSVKKIRDLVILNFSFFGLSLAWLYVFLLKNSSNFINFIEFNRRYAGIYKLSYPWLSLVKNPLDLLKLLPYYSPILLLILLYINKNKENIRVIPVLVALVGFFGTVFPTSDLLHVYPFYGFVLIAGLIFLSKGKYHKLWVGISILSIAIGFYLTIFREYYRYQEKYTLQDTRLNLPRTVSIYVDKPLSNSLTSTHSFLERNTVRGDYIFAYPFSPMFYFIFQRDNPSYYSIYYPGYLSYGQERGVIKELKGKKLRYIIVRSDYKFHSPLSEFIQAQRLVYNTGDIKIFKLK